MVSTDRSATLSHPLKTLDVAKGACGGGHGYMWAFTCSNSLRRVASNANPDYPLLRTSVMGPPWEPSSCVLSPPPFVALPFPSRVFVAVSPPLPLPTPPLTTPSPPASSLAVQHDPLILAPPHRVGAHTFAKVCRAGTCAQPRIWPLSLSRTSSTRTAAVRPGWEGSDARSGALRRSMGRMVAGKVRSR